MRTKDGTYDERFEVGVYGQREFKKIPKNKLIDFIPTIVESDREEMQILESWKAHFRNLKIPFAITRQFSKTNDRKIAYLSLWKEIRVH